MSMKPIATTRSATGIMTAKLAVWWLLASEIVIFGGLLAAYIMHRLAHPEWAFQAAHTNVVAGSVNTLVLLTSVNSFSMVERWVTRLRSSPISHGGPSS